MQNVSKTVALTASSEKKLLLQNENKKNKICIGFCGNNDDDLDREKGNRERRYCKNFFEEHGG